MNPFYQLLFHLSLLLLTADSFPTDRSFNPADRRQLFFCQLPKKYFPRVEHQPLAFGFATHVYSPHNRSIPGRDSVVDHTSKLSNAGSFAIGTPYSPSSHDFHPAAYMLMHLFVL